MPRMTDELKAYQDARVELEAAQAKVGTAALALAARVAQEGGPITRRSRRAYHTVDGKNLGPGAGAKPRKGKKKD